MASGGAGGAGAAAASATQPQHAGMKRALSEEEPVFEKFQLTPLGAGNEVGRSCLIMRYKGKTIMLDCGVLPSFQGEQALPLLREIDPAEIDIVIITHFHLDHSAALPYFTERMTGFRGRIFATHPTIAVMRLVLPDFVKVTTAASDTDAAAKFLYDERDIEACLSRIEAVDLRTRVNVNGVQFMFFNAGHVLGAVMALIEIGGVRMLYTGDYSVEEDRHLMAADIPKEYPPNILVVEATYGMQVHEPQEARERRFTDAVEAILKRGGRCLIPVFAVGRSQELLLILEEMWDANPALRKYPIYHASRMAEKSLEVYRTYISHMNARVQQAMSERNPWDFKYIRNIRGSSEFKDTGPCVVLAAPGMLQQGFSRELFDKWCEDPKNGIVLAGYSTEGTLARQLEQNPVEVESLSRRKLTRRMQIERVSFSAHADNLQTSTFIEALRPPVIVLVHGEKTEMARLHNSIARKYETTPGFSVWMPRNNTTVALSFQEQKMVRLIGGLAERRLTPGTRVSGVLVQRNFEHLLLSPADLPRFTQLATHTVAQKLHVPYRSSFAMLHAFVRAMYADTVADVSVPPPGSKAKPRHSLSVSGLVTVTHVPPDRVILSWSASPVADMVADSLVAVIAQAEVSQASIKATSRSCGHNHSHGSGGHGHHDHDHEHEHEHEHAGEEKKQESSSGGGAGSPRAGEAEAGEFGGADTSVPSVAEEAAALAWTKEVPWARALVTTDSGPPLEQLVPEYNAPADYVLPHLVRAYTALTVQLSRRCDALVSTLRQQYGQGSVMYLGPAARAPHAATASSASSSSGAHAHAHALAEYIPAYPIGSYAHATAEGPVEPQSFCVSVELDGKYAYVVWVAGRPPRVLPGPATAAAATPGGGAGASGAASAGGAEGAAPAVVEATPAASGTDELWHSSLERTAALVDSLFRPLHTATGTGGAGGGNGGRGLDTPFAGVDIVSDMMQ